jgi:hypothetical protein
MYTPGNLLVEYIICYNITECMLHLILKGCMIFARAIRAMRRQTRKVGQSARGVFIQLVNVNNETARRTRGICQGC